MAQITADDLRSSISKVQADIVQLEKDKRAAIESEAKNYDYDVKQHEETLAAWRKELDQIRKTKGDLIMEIAGSKNAFLVKTAQDSLKRNQDREDKLNEWLRNAEPPKRETIYSQRAQAAIDQKKKDLAYFQNELIQEMLKSQKPISTQSNPHALAATSGQSPTLENDSYEREPARKPLPASSPAYPLARPIAKTPDSPSHSAVAEPATTLPNSALAKLLEGFPLTTTELDRGAKRKARNTGLLSPIDKAVWASIESNARKYSVLGNQTVARTEVEELLTDVRKFLADQPDFFPGWVLQARLALALDRAPEGISAGINLNQLGVSGTAEPAVTRTVEQLGQRGW
ncbi:MAG: hypothetical protein WDM76_18075 [Limisphaerales bacterium]